MRTEGAKSQSSYHEIVWRYLLAACFCSTVPLEAQTRAADLSQAIRSTGLDPERCYRVRELSFAREDLKIYLTEGFVIFARPVEGRVTAAVFTAEVEGGDAEVLLMPPLLSERQSLAGFIETPNLEEHFRNALLLFTDDTAAEIYRHIEDRQTKPSQEIGLLLSQMWDPVVRNLSASFEVRLVADLLENSPARRGMYYMGVTGSRLGNFDVLYDPQAREQISVGQVAHREDRTFFDIWTSFESRRFRKGEAKRDELDFEISSFHIEASLSPELKLKVVTRISGRPRRTPLPLLAFDISRAMRVGSAKVNGVPAEVFQRESLRSNLIRAADGEMFLVVPARPLQQDENFEVELEHEGDVIVPAGNGVYYVAARGSWYPHHSLQYATYDLTFRYPKALSVVTTGDIVEDRVEGDWHVTHRRTRTPIRLAGFNLGDYLKYSAAKGGLSVEVYANRKIETALERPRPREITVIPSPQTIPRGGRRQPDVVSYPGPEFPQPNPVARAEQLAAEVSDAFEFLKSRFGPPPLTTIAVSPIPGTFGQGFPGLLYLSTLSYLDPRELPARLKSTQQQLFFSELLQTHEVAHQWWGNRVTSGGYHHDWLMEALANYSAVLYLEKKKGTRAMQAVMDGYRANLLAKDAEGKTVESTGPVDLGVRLHSSISPNAWRTIVYEKGAWVVHMLRRMMGDQRFFALLSETLRRYDRRSLASDDFQQLAASFLPPRFPDPKLETFFEQWVYSTGLPSLKLSVSIKGKAPKVSVSGTVRQTDVPKDFSVFVPVELQFGRGKTETRWLRTDNEGTQFTYTFPSAPLKVVLDPNDSVLSVKR